MTSLFGAAGLIANTDFGWFSHILHRANPPDEVDFWQPSPHGFRAIPPGAPFFFRLGAPHKAIAGYVLGMEGEKEFFQAAGLQDGDVVRKVNSINMTSQKRAEYLIREFLQSRISALVFDIERDNQAQKLIYFIR